MTATTKATRLRDLKSSARDQLMLDPRIIEIEEGHNPRVYTLAENRQHLDELKASIKENGVLQPLLVRFDGAKGKAVLVDGECRLRACLELITEGTPIEAVPTVQVSGASNEAERLVLALTANTGKPLSKWESGTAFTRLIRFGWEPEKIATRLGFTVRFVSEAIELADAPQEVKQMLSEQAVTPSLALQQLRVNSTQAVETLRARANAAKAQGKKTAKKERTGVIPQPKQVFKLLQALIQSSEDDIFDSDYKFIEVERTKLVKIAELMGFKKGE